jgi:hypothetical protein
VASDIERSIAVLHRAAAVTVVGILAARMVIENCRDPGLLAILAS